jgi:hypothetical protein
MLLRAAMTIVTLIAMLQPALATERLLKLRQYTFQCSGTQECTGWRHSFGFIDPAARNAELPRDAYVDVYTTQEVDALVDTALARRTDGTSALSEQERSKLRDDIAAEVLAQFSRMMAEQEAQTRAWLQDLVRQELKAAGSR